MELKKSYTGFVVLLIVFLAALFSICFLPLADNEEMPMRLIMLIMVWFMAGLSFHVWRTEQIYWYNGTTYEDAVAAGQERRKEFAWRHFVIFLRLALLTTAVCIATFLLGWSAWIDFAFATVGLVVACCFTLPIKL